MSKPGVAPGKLQVKAVHKSYADLKALNQVDLEIHSGQFVALLGLNGAGKSTLFQLLTGLYLADSGDILFDNQNMNSQMTSTLGKMGVVFQQITLDLDLTVKRNLLFHCGLHGINKPESIIVAALERAGLADKADTPCRALSGGNRRKVEIARSLLHRPQVLLMDEPTVGLDPASRDSIVKYVKQLCHEDGLAVLWATHLVDEADNADKVYILHHGNIIVSGKPQTIVEEYQTTDLLQAFLQITANHKNGVTE